MACMIRAAAAVVVLAVVPKSPLTALWAKRTVLETQKQQESYKRQKENDAHTHLVVTFEEKRKINKNMKRKPSRNS